MKIPDNLWEITGMKRNELLCDLIQENDELQDLLIQRDNEINALKHMLDRLDRKDEEK